MVMSVKAVAAEAPQLSNDAVQRLLEMSDDIACVLGFDGEVKEHNDRWLRDLGHSGFEIANKPFITFVHPQDRADTRRGLKMVSSGRSATAEIVNRLTCSDGTHRWLRWYVSADRGAQLLYCLAQEVATPGGEPDVQVEGRGPVTRRRLSRAHVWVHPDDVAGDHPVKRRATNDQVMDVLLETQTLVRDIGRQREDQDTIERQALTDSLTGLANRSLLADRLNQGLRHLERSPGFLGVLMLDLDHFKVINDTLGHQVGDAVLLEAARRLQSVARPDDTVARFGGDEFVVVVQSLADPADLTAFADRVVVELREPYRIGTEEVVATVSIGIAVASQPDHLPADLLREADMAMYRAKDQGRDRHEVYGTALQVRATQRLETERLVRRALAEDLLLVEYQPIIDVASGETIEAEALLRIRDGESGQFSPAHFLEVAQETGLMPAMDERVRAAALGELARWRATPSCLNIERLAVNLTARELANPEFAPALARSIEAAGLKGSDLSIEVTEHVLMQTSHSAVASLGELRGLGLRIGLDDFGTGFSALSYLQSFPLDFIKIDRSFVEGIAVDRRSSSIIRAMIDLAHALGLYVVAEGVETAEQLATLRDFACDRAQGFLFSPAICSEDFVSRLDTQAV